MTDDELSAELVLIALLPEGEARWAAEKNVVWKLLPHHPERAAELALRWWKHGVHTLQFVPLAQALRETGHGDAALRCLVRSQDTPRQVAELHDWSLELAVRRNPDEAALLGGVLLATADAFNERHQHKHRYVQALRAILPPLCDTPSVPGLVGALALLDRVKSRGAAWKPVLEVITTLPPDDALAVLKQARGVLQHRSGLRHCARLLATLPPSPTRHHEQRAYTRRRFTSAMERWEARFHVHNTLAPRYWHQLDRLAHWATTAPHPEARRVRVWLYALLGTVQKHPWPKQERERIQSLRGRVNR